MTLTTDNGYPLMDEGEENVYEDFNDLANAADAGPTYKLTLASDGTKGEWFYIDGSGEAELAQADVEATSLVIGCLTEDGLTGADRYFRYNGRITGLSGLTPGARYYLDPSTPGAMTTSKPSGPNYVVELGIAASATEFLIRIKVFLSGTSDHSLLSNLVWSAAGHTMDANLDMNNYSITEVNDLVLNASGDYVGLGAALTRHVYNTASIQEYVANALIGTWSATGLAMNTLAISGVSSLTTGALIATGNVDLGDAITDTITCTGRFDAHLIPLTDDTYDLGDASVEWRNLYIDGTAYIDTIAGCAAATITQVNVGTIANGGSGVTIAAADVLSWTTAHGTTLLIDHIGEHTGAHGVVIDNEITAMQNITLQDTKFVGLGAALTRHVYNTASIQEYVANALIGTWSATGLAMNMLALSGISTLTTGALIATGNVDLGDAITDSITCTGRFDAHLIPLTDDTYDLGGSGIEWKDLYIDGTANIDTIAGCAAATITQVNVGTIANGGSGVTLSDKFYITNGLYVDNVYEKTGSAGITFNNNINIASGKTITGAANLNFITAAASNIYFDAGGYWTFRDVDNANAEIITINTSTGTMQWTTTNGGITSAVGYILIGSAATQAMYFDAGGLFYWRDQDNADATRMTLDSSNGNLTLYGGLYVDNLYEKTGSAGITVNNNMIFATKTITGVSALTATQVNVGTIANGGSAITLSESVNISATKYLAIGANASYYLVSGASADHLYTTYGAICKTVQNGALYISGSNAYNSGGRIVLRGSTHATLPNTMDIRANLTIYGEVTLDNGNGLNLYEDITFLGDSTQNIINVPANKADALSIVNTGVGDLIVFDTTTGTVVTTLYNKIVLDSGKLYLKAGHLYDDNSGLITLLNADDVTPYALEVGAMEATSYSVNGHSGASGTFVDKNSNTVTVENGIITSLS